MGAMDQPLAEHLAKHAADRAADQAVTEPSKAKLDALPRPHETPKPPAGAM